MRGDVASADAPADLVELGEPERVGALDDERVRLRDVEARLDDRRRDEHVRVAGEEREHVLLELALAHLAVRDEEAELRAELAELLGGLLDRLDAVVQVEGLPLALVLPLERDLARAPRRTRRRACGSGGGPAGGVSITLMSRSPASDMCSVRGIGVAVSASTSTSRRSWRRSSFWATPKRCSSSTTTRPRSLGMTSRDRTRCVPIRTSTFPSANSAQHGLHVGRLPEARDHLHADGQVAVALAEGVPVLLREDRRRREDERLLAVQRRPRTPRARRPRSCRSRRRRRRAGPSGEAPRGPPSPPRSRAADPASPRRGSSPRAAPSGRPRRR